MFSLPPPDSACAPDEGAWATLWDRHQHDLVRYATYLLSGDRHTAEDVVQEAAVRLWRHPRVLDDDEPIDGWLRTVTHNLVVDRRRRRSARPPEVPLTVDDVVATGDSDAFDRVDAVGAARALLAVLPPTQRRAFVEVYLRDRPLAEVAAELGVPIGTVKSRCFAARRVLRAVVDDSRARGRPGANAAACA